MEPAASPLNIAVSTSSLSGSGMCSPQSDDAFSGGGEGQTDSLAGTSVSDVRSVSGAASSVWMDESGVGASWTQT